MARGWPPTRSWKSSIFWGGQRGRGAAGRWPWLGAAALGEQAAGARPPLTAVTVTGVLHLAAPGSSCVRLRQAPGSPRREEISFLDYVPALSQRHLSSRGHPPPPTSSFWPVVAPPCNLTDLFGPMPKLQ